MFYSLFSNSRRTHKLIPSEFTVIEMDVLDFVQSMVRRTRVWRERAITGLRELGCTDLSYRPKTGMSSVGWLLAHQAAVYDFSLNMVIKGEPPKNLELFNQHIPGTSGDYVGVSEQEIEEYYTSGESDLLAWVKDATDEDLLRTLEGEKIPKTFHGLTVIDFIANMFVHINHHNGHLNAIQNELKAKSE
jgi:hypothetical protein